MFASFDSKMPIHAYFWRFWDLDP